MGVKLQATARLLTIAVACVLSAGAGSAAVVEAVTAGVVTLAEESGSRDLRALAASRDSGDAATYEVPYRSEISSLGPVDPSVEATVRFEDAWFAGSPAEYDNELARTCAALSAACNSQSRLQTSGSRTSTCPPTRAAARFSTSC